LPIRAAKLAYSNGRYPTLEEIFDTLDAYKDEKIVIEFVNSNADMIALAKKIMATPKVVPEEKPVSDNPFGEIIQ